jgi:hypothetical protein
MVNGLIIVFLGEKIVMKQLVMVGLAAGLFLTACKEHRYKDLTSGAYVDLEKDESGKLVDKNTHKPVYIYVDTKTHDTIYGATGEVINGYVVKTGDGKYKYENNDGYEEKSGDYKIKREGDEVKIKDGDKKIKIEDGEKKVKKD